VVGQKSSACPSFTEKKDLQRKNNWVKKTQKKEECALLQKTTRGGVKRTSGVNNEKVEEKLPLKQLIEKKEKIDRPSKPTRRHEKKKRKNEVVQKAQDKAQECNVVLLLARKGGAFKN